MKDEKKEGKKSRTVSAKGTKPGHLADSEFTSLLKKQ